MNINLQIEQILLDDFNLSYQERLQLQTAVEAELSRLLTTNRLPSHLQTGGSIPSLSVPIHSSETSSSAQIAPQIAQSIYQGINGRHA